MNYSKINSESVIKSLFERYERTTLCVEFDRMRQSASPFLKYFGLNQFFYVRILPSGHYTTLGTNCEIQEFGFANPEIYQSLPSIRHPKYLKQGVFIENHIVDSNYSKTREKFLNKLTTNFTICIRRKMCKGVESFGFGTTYSVDEISNLLINELSLVYKFIDYFYSENKKLIQIAQEFQVNMIPLIGSSFYENKEEYSDLPNKSKLLRHMGIKDSYIADNNLFIDPKRLPNRM